MANVVLHYNYRCPSQSAINNGLPNPAALLNADEIGGLNLEVDSSEVEDADEIMRSFGFVQGVNHPQPLWDVFSFNYADLAAGAASNDVPLFELPARGMIKNVVIKHSQAFVGGGLVGYTVSVGVAGNFTKYAPTFDVFQAPSGTLFEMSAVQGIENFAAPTSIRLQAVSNGVNLNAATQGQVQVWVLWSTLPV